MMQSDPTHHFETYLDDKNGLEKLLILTDTVWMKDRQLSTADGFQVSLFSCFKTPAGVKRGSFPKMKRSFESSVIRNCFLQKHLIKMVH